MRESESLINVVLGEMAKHHGPVGARTIWRDLSNKGFALSESTVSRALSDLDSRELSRVVGKKGRELTTSGRRLADSLRADAQRNAQLHKALDINGPSELLDLLAARRGLERETVRAAAERATPAELAHLRTLGASEPDLRTPELWHERIEFHSYIGSITHNQQLLALTEVAFDSRHERLEHLLFLVGTHAGTLGASDVEHHAIADAINARDASTAERLMIRHIDRMMAEIADFAANTSTAVIKKLFQDNITAPSGR
ncbi:FadR/GntR family transcriptional regulator [Phytoactinopolyspora limicola]|uniref:FadR/GntR family transcriptional regulator n=1 Tax=Phytoactinopolyspora limicola TaxID=2715536 RepID=UPI001409FAB2|nr:FCD domain-containing protein [Phytoactinopolyspora limicola]